MRPSKPRSKSPPMVIRYKQVYSLNWLTLLSECLNLATDSSLIGRQAKHYITVKTRSEDKPDLAKSAHNRRAYTYCHQQNTTEK